MNDNETWHWQPPEPLEEEDVNTVPCWHLFTGDGMLARFWDTEHKGLPKSAALIENAPRLVEALRKAYRELNAIHARCGVPWWETGKSDMSQEYFTSVVEECRAALNAVYPEGIPQ